jgi:prepilin-type N-terminal cleavage/methylation domain-containing protein
MGNKLRDPGWRGSRGFSLLELLLVVALLVVITVIALPMSGNALASFRLSGDARSVSNAMAVAKMRAASKFTRVRLYVDLGGGTHHIETWDKDANGGAGGWVTEGGLTYLSTGVAFGYDPAATAPPDTQGTIGQAPECTDDDGDAIGNTACVMFNSRGIPVVDVTYTPTADDAIYLTDGTSIYGITVAATGMVRTWNAPPAADPDWVTS